MDNRLPSLASIKSTSELKVANWETRLDGLPQGAVWGSVLFLLGVGSLPGLLSSLVLIYADDVKIWRAIKSKSDSLELQNDLLKLSEGSKIRQLPINAPKCIMMHLVHQGTYTYTVNYSELLVVMTHNDLGVIVNLHLKTNPHCQALALKVLEPCGQHVGLLVMSMLKPF